MKIESAQKIVDNWNELLQLIKDTFPNYDKVFKGVKALREMPVGNFVAFPAEIARTSAHIVAQGVKEATSGNPVLMKRGLQRLAGFTTLNAGWFVAGQAGYRAFGFSEVENEGIQTNAEKLTLAAYNMTNNPNFLSQPLLVPGNADYGALMKAYNQALETGNKQIFFQALKGLQDITAGNPNTQYFNNVSGTDWQDWYRRPTVTTGGGGSTGGSGYGYGYGYGGGHHPGTTGGGVFAAKAAHRYWGPGKARGSTGAPLAEALAYRQANPVRPQNIKMYTQSLVNANRGGKMNLRR